MGDDSSAGVVVVVEIEGAGKYKQPLRAPGTLQFNLLLSDIPFMAIKHYDSLVIRTNPSKCALIHG